MEESDIEQIEQILDVRFSDRSLLRQIFTHSSVVDNRLLSNERLEFFGDSILGMVICQILFERFPDYLEGDLTKIKSMLVSRRTCAGVARKLGLHQFLTVGKSLVGTRAVSGSLAAALLEAVIAAIYIDSGFEAARGFTLRAYDSLIDKADAQQTQGNFKSLLQQYTQQRFNSTPVYTLLDEKGPDHKKCFESEVVIAGRHFPSAWGMNKKEAEQKAAFNTLVELRLLPDAETEENGP